TREVCEALRAFADDVYLHQVVVRRDDGQRVIYRDLPDALACEAPVEVEDEETNRQSAIGNQQSPEWRIHFHIPLHSPPTELFGNTADHLVSALDLLATNPALCSHLEMETYTWEVLPPELKNRN